MREDSSLIAPSQRFARRVASNSSGPRVKESHGRGQRMVIKPCGAGRGVITGDLHNEVGCGVRMDFERAVRPQTEGELIGEYLVVGEVESPVAWMRNFTGIERDPVGTFRNEVDDRGIA